MIPDKRPDVKVALTGYSIAGKGHTILNLSSPPDIVMDYNEQLISFEVTSLDFSYSGKNHFSYFLKGFDNQWHNLPSGNEITFTNINPGHYQLHVKHALQYNTAGDDTLVVNLTVRPPFYLTQTAYWLYAIASIGLLAWIILWRKKKRQQQKNLKQASAPQKNGLSSRSGPLAMGCGTGILKRIKSIEPI